MTKRTEIVQPYSAVNEKAWNDCARIEAFEKGQYLEKITYRKLKTTMKGPICWVEGDTTNFTNHLKNTGFKYSAKENKWYFISNRLKEKDWM
ncbi:MAG: hypothetical protein KBS60_02765 [Phascolarctobacterium sp.]|nr:hypothetical protein [Candidatus Phascolarctobacterium caballi]